MQLNDFMVQLEKKKINCKILTVIVEIKKQKKNLMFLSKS